MPLHLAKIVLLVLEIKTGGTAFNMPVALPTPHLNVIDMNLF